jgi:CRP-like cAMP-binding protein
MIIAMATIVIFYNSRLNARIRAGIILFLSFPLEWSIFESRLENCRVEAVERGQRSCPDWEEAVPSAQIEPQNRLLSALTPKDLALLTPHLAHHSLDVKQTLETPNRPIETCYFVESGYVSVVAVSARGRHVETGLVGREGMTGLAVVMGDDRSPNETYVQAAGSAFGLPADDLRRLLADSPALNKRLLLYARAFLIQTTHTALANGTAKIEERLARWILMAQDRLEIDDLPLTHEFVAVMLAVRRPGVTEALHQLEARGVIRARRGHVLVVDRTGLLKIANGSYGVPEAEYRRLLG